MNSKLNTRNKKKSKITFSSSTDAILNSTQATKDSKQRTQSIINLKKMNSTSSIKLTSTRTFLPINEINVNDRKMLRKVSQMTKIETDQFKLKKYYSSIPQSQLSSSHYKQMSLSSTISSNDNNKPMPLIKTSSRNVKIPLKELIKMNPYHYVSVSLKDTIDKYTRLNAHHSQPNIRNAIKSHHGTITKPCSQCTFYIKKESPKSNLIKRLIKINIQKNEFMSSNFKMAIKWEGICQLWNNHIVVLEKLIKSYREYKWFLDKEPLITMGALKEFLHLVNIEDNNNFCDDVFSLFEKEEKIDIKEFFQSVIIVSDNSYEKKSKFIVDVWENNQTGFISFKVISRLLKFACHSKKDYDAIIHKIKEVVEDLEMIPKSKVLKVMLYDGKVRLLLERNLNFSKERINAIFKDEIMNVINGNIRSWQYNMSDHDIQMFCKGEVNSLERLLMILDTNDKMKNHTEQIQKENNFFDN